MILNVDSRIMNIKCDTTYYSPGGMPAGIDPSILTSAAFELVQASQALQAVQAVQPLLASESPPLMTPLTQVTTQEAGQGSYLLILKLQNTIQC